MPMTTTLGKLFWSDNENNDYILCKYFYIFLTGVGKDKFSLSFQIKYVLKRIFKYFHIVNRIFLGIIRHFSQWKSV